MQGEDSTTQLSHPHPSVNIRNSANMKSRKSTSEKRSNIYPIQTEQPVPNPVGNIYGFNPVNSKNHFNYWNSVEINQYYMNERGVDSVPTNFSRKEANTSHEKRLQHNRNMQNAEKSGGRNAITAKSSHRNWKHVPESLNKNLTCYNDNDDLY